MLAEAIARKVISIHAPLAGCDSAPRWGGTGLKISIHAPLAGCDRRCPAGRAGIGNISIHAPLAGCDHLALQGQIRDPRYFNPRTPCGVRQLGVPVERLKYGGFQSTHPLRGATSKTLSISSSIRHFNPRTPCGVRRLPAMTVTASSLYFNPRTPCGVRLHIAFLVLVPVTFQSTHPLRGATAKMHKIFCAFCDNRQFYRVSPSGVPSVGALFTYSRGLQRAGAGANLPVNGCALGLRAKSSASPQAGRSACSRSVRFYSRTSCRGNKTAGCRVPDP